MIYKYYKIECDYCGCNIYYTINTKPSTKQLRKHCKVVIRNGKIITYHHECFNKLNNN